MKKPTLSLVMLLLLLLLGTTTPRVASPQFKKYQLNQVKDKKEKQKQKQKQKQTQTQKTQKTLPRKDKRNQDAFGRPPQTGSFHSQKKTEKQKKYVNLNPETAFGPEVVKSFDFPNASLAELTTHMQKLTGINLIIDKELKGKVHITAPTPITVGDAWKAYLAVLNINGYTLVKTGAFYKIVQTKNIRYNTTKIYTGPYSPDTETYMMKVVPLRNINATEVSRKLNPFMTRYGKLTAIAQTNTILLLETGTNINRISQMLKILDVPGHEETLQIIPVKHSSAQEIAKLLDDILKSRSSSTSRRSKRSSKARKGRNISKIIAEPRTNSIIAMANADGARKLRGLIKKLDVELVSSGGGQIHVYYLNYGDAETLAKTLSSLVSGSQPKKGKSSPFTRSGSSNLSATLFKDSVKITADKANNAIVLTASPTDYLTIKEVIKKLDIPRDQVFVEGMIMETLVKRNRNFGISIIGAYGPGGLEKGGFFGVPGEGQNLINLLTNNITELGGLFLGKGLGKEVKLNIGGKETKVHSLNALISAIATNDDTNVLATPQILALDNEEAVFEVGETVPVVNTTTTSGGLVQNSVKQQPVTLKLKITPQINKTTRFIRLKIDQKFEDFSKSQASSGSTTQGGVATTTRSTVTTVVVRDRDTIAMGGLMRDKTSSIERRVPLLSAIPVIGWLFRNSEKTSEKVNMLFFLTPKIMASYQKETASTVKELLNRRNIHMKNTLGKEDPFASAAKALYEKADRQGQGPLFEQTGKDDEEEEKALEGETPDYRGIVDEVEVYQPEGETP